MKFGTESETLEFKESTGELHQAVESIAAILNKHESGKIYFGIDDAGNIKGQVISDSTFKTVSDAILRDIEPRIIPTIEKEEHDGKTILKVSFKGTQKPYSAFGRFLTRVGTQNRAMTRNELRKLIKQEDYSFPWEKEIYDMTLDDFDDQALYNYYQEAVGCGRLTLPSYDKESLLTVLDLYKNGKFNNAAFALFGKNANIKLKVACFATDEKLTFTDLNSIRGNIYNLIQFGVTYILNHIDWRISIGLKREETPEIPVQAIREIIVNAFAHAMYQPTPEIEINIHPGHITIFNPGSFPDDLTPRDFVTGTHSSIKRNPLILDVLYRCKNVEKTGTGFKRVDKMCVESGVRWDSRNSAYGFYFTFYRNRQQAPKVIETAERPMLSDIEMFVFTEIKNNPKISRTELSNTVGRSVRSIQRITNTLVEKGYLIRIGNNQFGYWEIVH